MKVVVADGNEEADYIIRMYHNRQNSLVVINSSSSTANELSRKNRVDVIFGKPTSEYDLRLAGIENADLFLALGERDVDNYVACKMAKLLFGAKRTIAIVKNPENVDLFKSLGVDFAVCSTYLLGETIEREASIESLIKTLSFEDNKITMLEITVEKDSMLAKIALKDLRADIPLNVCCIFRNPNVLIPNGQTVLLPRDKVFAVSSSEHKAALLQFLSKKKS